MHYTKAKQKGGMQQQQQQHTRMNMHQAQADNAHMGTPQKPSKGHQSSINRCATLA